MNQLTKVLTAFCCVSLFVFGCNSNGGKGDSTSASEAVTFAQVTMSLEADIDSPSCPHTIEYPDIKSMRLRIFEGEVDDAANSRVLFDTSNPDIAPDGCLSFVQCSVATVRMDADGTGGSYESRIEACTDAGGSLIPATLINVQELPSAGGVTAYLELFTDADCSEDDLAFLSTRADINVAPGEPENIHMAPLCKGHFTTLPSPTREDIGFLRDLALTECERDCDCVEPFKDILKKECTESQLDQIEVPGAPVHCVESRCTANYGFEWLISTSCEENSECTALFPNSTCGTSGYCDIDYYYPLEPNRNMAFHSATELPDGSIALAGGFNISDGDALSSYDAHLLRFNPYRLTFQEIELNEVADSELANDAGDRGLHTTTTSETGDVLVLSGGIRSLNVRFETDEAGIRRIKISPEDGGPVSDENFHSDILVVEGNMLEESAMARQTSLKIGDDDEQPVALQVVDLVLNQGQGEHLFATGLVPEGSPAAIGSSSGQDNAPFGNLAVNCRFRSSDLEVSCLVNTGVFASPRAGSTQACFSRDEEGRCEEFSLIGGSNSTEARVGELFVPGTPEANGKFVKLDSDGADMLRRAKFSEVVEAEGGKVFLFGGTNEELFEGPPNLPTMILSLDEPDSDTPSLAADPISGKSSFGGVEATFRSHHEVVQLLDGDILVTGGLNSENLPTSQVLILDTENEEYRDAPLKMNRPRFAHEATRINVGLLRGSVLITGGLSVNTEDGAPYYVRTTEIFVP